MKKMSIIIKNLDKSYHGKKILNNLSIMVKNGEMIAITGKSGSGKSTFLNIIGLLEKPDAGTISIDGTNHFSRKTRRLFLRDKIGFIFQNFALIEEESIRENLALALHHIPKGKKETEMKKALQEVGIHHDLKTKIYTLSGGEQQRVAIARVLLKKCDIILADEPTGSLDEENRDHIMQLIKKLNDQGKTIIIVTHDQKVAAYCDRIIDLDKENKGYSHTEEVTIPPYEERKLNN